MLPNCRWPNGLRWFFTIYLILQLNQVAIVYGDKNSTVSCINDRDCIENRQRCLLPEQLTPNSGTGICVCLPGYHGPQCEPDFHSIPENSEIIDQPSGRTTESEIVTPNPIMTTSSDTSLYMAESSPKRNVSLASLMPTPVAINGSSIESRESNPINSTTEISVIQTCKDRPCLNRGRCADQENNTFVCTCRQGFYGDRCEHNHCGKCEHGLCASEETEEESLNSTIKYRCFCKQGFTGIACDEDVNECLAPKCQNNATCVNVPGSFRCDCSPGFEGKLCEHQINECLKFKPCQNGAKCTDLLADYHCECPAGYEGKNCERDINECATTPCHNNGTCVDLVNNFECKCASGFQGRTCEINVDDCAGITCEQGARCEDLVNDFRCHCPKGFKGKRCEHEINECESQPCQNDGLCVQKSGSSNGRLASHDVERNETSRANSTMVDETDELGYFCKCLEGFEGVNCEINIDDCKSVTCKNNGTCVDGVGEATCDCPSGFSGDRCEINVDECLPNPCLNNGKCEDKVNDYVCICTGTGFTGRNCTENIDECASAPCANDAHCVDLQPFFHCECLDGFFGKLCDQDVQDCELHPCHNNGICYERSDPTLYGYSNPDSPFYGIEYSHHNASGYVCKCLPGITGANCDFNINECQNVNCNHGECKDGINTYRCACHAGYTGKHCEQELNECEPNPCSNRGTCEDRLDGFICHCPPLVFGNMCQYRFTGCDSNPCMHNGTCRPDPAHGNQSAMCDCVDGYEGEFCEQAPRRAVDWLLLLVITSCCLLVLLLLLLSLLFVRSVKRARATRGTYSPSTQEMFGNSASEILKPPPEERLI